MKFINKGRKIDTDASERLRATRVLLGLTKVAFADEIGVDPNFLYMIETKKRELSVHLAIEICKKFPEIDFIWLITGLKNKH